MYIIVFVVPCHYLVIIATCTGKPAIVVTFLQNIYIPRTFYRVIFHLNDLNIVSIDSRRLRKNEGKHHNYIHDCCRWFIQVLFLPLSCHHVHQWKFPAIVYTRIYALRNISLLECIYMYNYSYIFRLRI